MESMNYGRSFETRIKAIHAALKFIKRELEAVEIMAEMHVREMENWNKLITAIRKAEEEEINGK